MAVTMVITYFTLGETVLLSFIPVWALSLIYPLMKRFLPFPQIVLGAIVGGAVFPGWVCVTGTLDNLSAALPLLFATAAWVVYFDIFYATQDRPDDIKIGVQSLAVLAGRHARILLAVLGAVQIGFFVLAALRAQLSPVFWLLGLAPWIVNVPIHILSLDLDDRHSGGAIFMANIKLGLYLAAVSLVEILIHHVPLGLDGYWGVLMSTIKN